MKKQFLGLILVVLLASPLSAGVVEYADCMLKFRRALKHQAFQMSLDLCSIKRDCTEGSFMDRRDCAKACRADNAALIDDFLTARSFLNAKYDCEAKR